MQHRRRMQNFQALQHTRRQVADKNASQPAPQAEPAMSSVSGR